MTAAFFVVVAVPAADLLALPVWLALAVSLALPVALADLAVEAGEAVFDVAVLVLAVAVLDIDVVSVVMLD